MTLETRPCDRYATPRKRFQLLTEQNARTQTFFGSSRNLSREKILRDEPKERLRRRLTEQGQSHLVPRLSLFCPPERDPGNEVAVSFSVSPFFVLTVCGFHSMSEPTALAEQSTLRFLSLVSPSRKSLV